MTENPISTARTNDGIDYFVYLRRERHPAGIRLRIGPLQIVVGYVNRFAIWWGYHAIVDLYRMKPLEPLS